MVLGFLSEGYLHAYVRVCLHRDRNKPYSLRVFSPQGGILLPNLKAGEDPNKSLDT